LRNFAYQLKKTVPAQALFVERGVMVAASVNVVGRNTNAAVLIAERDAL